MSRNRSNIVFKIFMFLIIVPAVLATLIPFINIIALSLSDAQSIISNKVALLPVGFNVDSYKVVFENVSMLKSLVFSVFLTVLYTLISMVMTTCAAYPLSKTRLKGRRILTFVMIFTMYFSGGIIPDYILMRSLNITNTIWCLILPGMISVYNMIILKNFISSVPLSIEEAARVDGGNDFQILFKIILPLSKSALATVSLFYVVSRWNTFQDALFYITKPEYYTLQLTLNKIINMTQTGELSQSEAIAQTNIVPENIKAASIVFATVPVLLAYPWLQKYFVSGIMVGAVKG